MAVSIIFSSSCYIFSFSSTSSFHMDSKCSQLSLVRNKGHTKLRTRSPSSRYPDSLLAIAMNFPREYLLTAPISSLPHALFKTPPPDKKAPPGFFLVPYHHQGSTLRTAQILRTVLAHIMLDSQQGPTMSVNSSSWKDVLPSASEK